MERKEILTILLEQYNNYAQGMKYWQSKNNERETALYSEGRSAIDDTLEAFGFCWGDEWTTIEVQEDSYCWYKAVPMDD